MTLLGFLDILVLVLHITVCVFLVGIVLVQGGKGASLSASFGMGSSSSAFGAQTDSFMTKLTSGAAIAFVVTSIGLTLLATRTGSLSQRVNIEDRATAAAPASEVPAPTVTETVSETSAVGAPETAPAAP